ncbi:hypothetical protein Ddc_03442 [Ditylenchus destructor]|nr:hypothetical protein Ddc_03442 [Ditylenchus destructor]
MSNAEHFSHRNSDYIHDVTMDIASSFFPPPIVLLPPNDILPALKKYEYDFKTEKQMVLKYEEEQIRLKQLQLKEEEQSHERQRQLEPTNESVTDSPPSSSCSSPPSSSSSTSTATSSLDLQRIHTDPQTVPMIPLIPATKLVTPVVPGINQSKLVAKTTQPTKEIRKLHGFEEFEVATSVFDELELRSLDDRTELAKLRL